MKRQEIIDGVDQILSALERSSIVEQLDSSIETLRNKPSDSVDPNLLNSLRLYSVYAFQFNEAAREISDILNLTVLEHTGNWVRLTGTPGSLVLSIHRIVRFAVEHLPKILSLLKPEAIRRYEEGRSSNYSEMSVLTVNVFEDVNVFSSPARLSNVLESIDHLYTACALLNGESPSSISVISCDSGSDKSFDFLGIARLMECVERIIGTIFDRVFFFREHQFEERMDLVTKALPIIQQINKLEEHKELSPEMAELLRRNIFDGANKFIQSGATIPKIEDKSEYNARLLLSPVQKLLVAAPEASTEAAGSESGDNSVQENKGGADQLKSDNLSEEEKDQLIRLLEKSKFKTSDQSTENINPEPDQATRTEETNEDSP